MTLAEIKDEKLTCVVHTKSKTEAMILTKYMPQKDWRKNPLDYWEHYGEETGYYIEDGQLFQYSPVSFYKNRYPQFGEIYELSDLFATGGTISIHDLPTSEWYNPMRLSFKNGSSIEALPKETNAVRGNGCLNPPEFVFDAKQAEELAERLNKELSGHFNAFANNGISAKNGGKNSMKFTFYTVEGYRMDKSNNTKIPTVTTEVVYKDKDGCATGGSATCDKVDYDERQGVVEALANAAIGNFEREYRRAVQQKKVDEKNARTCSYCGEVFDTVSEKDAHEAWHVERRKARRERYLLRKRAKEIAFEEAAQKLAKEMTGDKK